MIAISQSTYHADPKLSRLARAERDVDVRGQIEQIRVEFPRTGYRTLLAYLKRNGVKIGETKLRRIISDFDLHLRPKKKFVTTTDSNHKFEVYKNLLPEMTVDGINQVWVADITYVRILTCFVYVAIILDVYSRKVVGHAISKRIDGNLAIDALNMALQRRRPPKGVIHHSDRGVQYLCNEYVKVLKANDFHISCSRKGNPYDNAFAESFMKTLKYDEVYMWGYETYLDVIERVPYFIEEVYNKKRVHSGLNYDTPEEFEKRIEVAYEGVNRVDRPTLTL